MTTTMNATLRAALADIADSIVTSHLNDPLVEAAGPPNPADADDFDGLQLDLRAAGLPDDDEMVAALRDAIRAALRAALRAGELA